MKIVAIMAPRIKSYPGCGVRPPYHSPLQAHLWLQFCLAASLLGQPVQNPRFYAEAFDEAEVIVLTEKIEVTTEEGRATCQPRVEVWLTDGQVLVVDEDKTPVLSWDDEPCKEQFLASAEGVFDSKTSRNMMERVM